MKSVLVMGVGAQGSTIAKHLNDHPAVTHIICADYDRELAEGVSALLDKASAIEIDARNLEQIIEAARGCAYIFNGLPLEHNLNVMEAALAVGANYMDLSGPMEEIGFVKTYQSLFSDWHQRFAEQGLTALVGCGIAPGLANVLVRDCVDEMDSCDFLGIYFYDNFLTKRFIPFWWSPEVALSDMAYKTFRYEQGQIVLDAPFSRPRMMTFRGVEQPVRMVDHEHDEPVTMGLLANSVLKGVKDVEFKYGGPQVELSEHLYKMGLLSKEPIEVKGVMVAPMDVVLAQIPRAPRFEEEIQQVIDEGILQEEGVFLVRAHGQKDGQPLHIDCYTNFPGLAESFAKAQMTHESYSTGQCAAVFAKLMVAGLFSEPGVYVPEQLGADCRRFILKELEELDITVDRYRS